MNLITKIIGLRFFVTERNIFGCDSKKVGLKSRHNKYVTAERDGTANANSDNLGLWQTFTVEDKGENRVSFKSFHGKYLGAQSQTRDYDITAEAPARNVWETFTAEYQTGGTVALKTYHGGYVVAKEDGRLKGGREVANNWDRFTPECVKGTFNV